MKIAQIVCVFPPYRGGIGNSVYNISKSIAGLGHEVTIITPDYNFSNEDYSSENPLKNSADNFIVNRLKPLFKIGNGALIPQLFLKLKGYDVIHLHYPFYGAVKAALLKKILSGKKLKLIMHYHMDNRAAGAKGFIFYSYRKLFLPLLARSAKIITCASLDYIKHSDLGRYYQKRPDKFKQISFGVDLEQFVIYKDNASKNRDHFSLLFVGGLDKAHYFKGLENLIKALAQIKNNSRFKNIRLKVVGGGDLINYYRKLTGELALKNEVTFHENIDNDELVNFYNHCDCLVLPSINKSEAFGLVLLEAMACAKPVITSNLPGVRSVFKNGRQGLLVKPNDVGDLVKKIEYLLSDRKRMAEMGRAGRELVEKKYTWSKVAKRLDSIYYRVKYT